MNGVVHTPPQLPNAWASDRVLRETLQWLLGDELFSVAEPELADMGRTATSTRTLELAARAEREPPEHVPYSTWGERIDDIRVSPSWTELGRLGVESGVTALPYEHGPYGSLARVVWGALVAMWGPSSALYSCPVAMTDGAARTLLEHGEASDLSLVERLTTRNFERAWTSGQWMTEMTGGSDVGRTETRARRESDGSWRLYGTKWFTSATTSEMALTLARPEGAASGARGLALFRLHRHLESGERNAIFVRRLKDKLGTRALPTAELELQGAVAHPIGDASGGGVKRIASMLNVTRVHNSIAAAAALGRGLAWARAYAGQREVFGRPLHSLPAHRATLTDLAVDYCASLALVMRCCELMGRAERGDASTDERTLLRGLTPVTKLTTGRWSVAGVTEAMETIGGVGYCEDSTIPALVRDAHVIPIWEGTTNVLALDVLRAERGSGAASAVLADALRHVDGLLGHPTIGQPAAAVVRAVDELSRRLSDFGPDPEGAQAGARSFALGLGATYACARLCRQGQWAAASGSSATPGAAARLAARGLVPAGPPVDLELAMDEVQEQDPELS